MKSLPLNQLRHELCARGYPRAYTARLVAELHDHLETTKEDSDDEQGAEQAECTLGSLATLVTAVEEFPELKTWSQRFPSFVFVACPGIIICLLTAGTVCLAEWIARGNIVSPDWTPFVTRVFEPASLALFALVALTFAALAVRARVHTRFSFAAMLLISASGTFATDLAYCDQSDGSIAFSRFDLNLGKLVATLGVFAVVWTLGGWLVRRERQSSTTKVAGSQTGADRLTATGLPNGGLFRKRNWQPLIVTIGTLALVVLFAKVADLTAKKMKRHPADNLIADIDSREHHEQRLVELLGFESVLSDLDVDAKHAEIVREVAGRWSEYSRDAVSRWHRRNPGMAGFAKFQREMLQPYREHTASTLESLLTPEQNLRLQQIIRQQMGWDVLYLSAVQREMDLSFEQRARLKDLLVERTRRTSRLHRVRAQGPDALANDMQSLRDWYLSEIHDILSAKQLNKLGELRGPECPLPTQLTASF